MTTHVNRTAFTPNTTALLLSMLLMPPALADGGSPAPQPWQPGVASSVINGAALSEVRGRFAVNIAAGDSNAQTNAAALAIGLGDSSVGAYAGVIAATDARVVNHPGVAASATAVIAEHAFANAVGMVSVNQTSGAGNAQANTVALGVGFEVGVVAESSLAATAPGVAPVGSPGAGPRLRGVSIADTAFAGSRGLVQVNQSAGSGNSTANNFALRVETGAKP